MIAKRGYAGHGSTTVNLSSARKSAHTGGLTERNDYSSPLKHAAYDLGSLIHINIAHFPYQIYHGQIHHDMSLLVSRPVQGFHMITMLAPAALRDLCTEDGKCWLVCIYARADP
jgi:hypothetical protein